MDFAMSAKAQDHHKRLTAFMTEFVFPAEEAYDRYRREAGPDDHTVPPVIEELKTLAKERGLWNLFLPAVSGLTNLEYAPLAELTGWSLEIAPEVTNCAALSFHPQFSVTTSGRRRCDRPGNGCAIGATLAVSALSSSPTKSKIADRLC